MIQENNTRCFGCGACVDACPHQAINLVPYGEYGYYYPSINSENCLNCKICERVCQLSDEPILKSPLEVFCGVTKNHDDFEKSSSGGAFKVIVKSCVDIFKNYKHFYCAGCVFTDNFLAMQDIIEIKAINDVDVFSKSKYILSNATGVYRKTKNILKSQDNFVIFTGTPCQINALYNYLGCDYINLITIDVICGGAQSQISFDKHRYEIEENEHSKIHSYNFRDKQNGVNSKLSRYELENGRYVTIEQDYSKKIRRHSCSSCRFKIDKRVSDITIGDAWGIDKKNKNINAKSGISVILVNTDKSKQLIDKIKEQMVTYNMKYEDVIKYHEALRISKIMRYFKQHY